MNPKFIPKNAVTVTASTSIGVANLSRDAYGLISQLAKEFKVTKGFAARAILETVSAEEAQYIVAARIAAENNR